MEPAVKRVIDIGLAHATCIGNRRIAINGPIGNYYKFT